METLNDDIPIDPVPEVAAEDPNKIVELVGPGGLVKVKRKHAGQYLGKGYREVEAEPKADR